VKQPKILLYDIETSPNLGYTWGKWQQNVLDFIKERELLCFSYKYVGSGKIRCISRKGDKSDLAVVAKLAKLINEADVSIAHNGDEFDRKVLKTRMLYWKLPPLRPGSTIDTLKAAKAYFSFSGNSLDDLCRYLKIGRKMPTPGFSMWLGCMFGKKADWAKMVKYNKHDVSLLSEVYGRLKPWIENHPNMARAMNPYGKEVGCPSCGSGNKHKNGFRVTAALLKQVWKCNVCNRQWLAPLRKV